ncbi:MAG: hypothetical protein COZ56_11440 [Armatimonadetes bacterium CG_4_8_14_3_um_filter_58_9]|nr:MAG: hypothetical protein COZ56_11440 [Armatimonadetes bacterium CG_4_8_14_3_um_filter_58_9]
MGEWANGRMGEWVNGRMHGLHNAGSFSRLEGEQPRMSQVEAQPDSGSAQVAQPVLSRPLHDTAVVSNDSALVILLLGHTRGTPPTRGFLTPHLPARCWRGR